MNLVVTVLSSIFSFDCIMQHAKTFSIFVITIVGIYFAIGFYFLPLAGFDGDLTRIACLPESLFGWTKPQPKINSKYMKQSKWNNADVLVLGDSFSYGRIWQTVLVRHGLHVHTEHFVLHNVCGGFADWVRSKGFKGKYIVLEVLEVNAAAQISRAVSCEKLNYPPALKYGKVDYIPPTVIDRGRYNYSGKISIGFLAWYQERKYLRLSAQPNFKMWDTKRGVDVIRMHDGCELFSHPSCHDVLFYAKDDKKDLSDTIIRDMQLLGKRLPGFKVIWVIVPNKTTSYLYPNKKFWQKASKYVYSVNLLKTVRRAISDKVKDVYPGNNEHFSTSTYLLMGKSIYNYMMTLNNKNLK